MVHQQFFASLTFHDADMAHFRIHMIYAFAHVKLNSEYWQRLEVVSR